MTDDKLSDWEDENDSYLTECVSFWWSFATPGSEWDGVLGDYEEAGTHLAC